MQWQIGSTHLDFNDVGLRPAYQPRHAISKRHQQPRASLAEEVGLGAARTQGYVHHQTAAGCQSYGFPPVSIRQLLLDRAANLVRLHSRRLDGRKQPPRRRWGQLSVVSCIAGFDGHP
jgi:hypothetical protein